MIKVGAARAAVLAEKAAAAASSRMRLVIPMGFHLLSFLLGAEQSARLTIFIADAVPERENLAL